MSDWPKRPDGSNMTVGEMTPEDARRVTREAAERLKAQFADPARKARIQAVLDAAEKKLT
jgi:hypothetical protein